MLHNGYNEYNFNFQITIQRANVAFCVVLIFDSFVEARTVININYMLGLEGRVLRRILEKGGTKAF